MATRYVMREKRKKSKLPYIIISLIYLLISLFVAYNYISYKQLNGIREDSFSVFFSSFNILGMAEGFSAPFTIETLKETVRLNFFTNAIFIHVTVILLSLLCMSGGKTRSEFKNVEHGSADWAKKSDEKYFKDTSGIPIAKDFYVSLNEKVVKVKGYGDVKQAKLNNLNQIIIASSGMGKSFRCIEPQIMNMYGSYVITDPKGELYRNTCKLLKQNGYNVKVLNLYDINSSDRYNPFRYIKSEQDVIKIGSLFMKTSSGKGDKEDFWAASSEMIFTGILGYLFLTEGEEKTFGRAARLLTSISYRNGALNPSCEYAKCMKKHAEIHKNDMVSLIYNAVKGTVEQTLSGQVSTLQTRLKLWLTKGVDELTEEDDIDLDMFAEEGQKNALFVITPPADTTYTTVVTMFYSQLFSHLQLLANEKCNGTLPQHVSVLMDEFANCSQMKDFEKFLSVCRSYNIRVAIVLQGLSQLKALYKDQYTTILNNCAIFSYLGGSDEETTKYVSNRLGKTTIRVETKSYNRSGSGGGSDNESYISRELLTAQEVPLYVSSKKGEARKYDGKIIVFIEGFLPFGLMKYDTLSHPNMKYVGSSFKKDWHNNTDIKEEFAKRRANKPQESEESEIKADLPTEAQQEQSVDTEEYPYDEQKQMKEEFESIIGNEDTEIVKIEDISEEELLCEEYYDEFEDDESEKILEMFLREIEESEEKVNG